MQTVRKCEVFLPQRMADFVESMAQSEHYASVNEVLCDGVRDLMAHEAKFEKRLRDELVASYDEHKPDPGSTVPIEHVVERLRARASERAAKQNT